MAINNKVILIGNLGSDAEFVKTEKSKFVSLSLCTQDSYKDRESGEWVKRKPEWHKVSVFNKKLIEPDEGLSAKDLKKGERIEVEGDLVYVDRERDGVSYKQEFDMKKYYFAEQYYQ